MARQMAPHQPLRDEYTTEWLQPQGGLRSVTASPRRRQSGALPHPHFCRAPLRHQATHRGMQKEPPEYRGEQPMADVAIQEVDSRHEDNFRDLDSAARSHPFSDRNRCDGRLRLPYSSRFGRGHREGRRKDTGRNEVRGSNLDNNEHPNRRAIPPKRYGCRPLIAFCERPFPWICLGTEL